MKKDYVRKITTCAMLSAVSAVLMFFSFSVPLMPGFIKFDFSELPALLAAFALGPVYGVVVCLVKNLINLFFTTTGGVGEFANFLLGAMLVLPAGLIYKFKKDRIGALLGAVIGSAVMAVASLPINYFITYPFYAAAMLPMENIIAMYQAINPKVETLLDCLLWFNVPFTFVKGIAVSLITFLIYKPLSPILKAKKA